MLYYFGCDDGITRRYKVGADNIEMAIKIFNVDVLFPEEYVKRSDVLDKEEYDTNSSYGSDYVSFYTVKPNSKIDISTYSEADKEFVFIKSIPISECINVIYDDIPTQKLLTGRIDENPDSSKEIANTSDNSKSSLTLFSKKEVRDAQKEMYKQMDLLHAKSRELKEKIEGIRDSLDNKVKALRLYSAYLGEDEEVTNLAFGKSADPGSPIHIFQQLLYMDEEVGIWENEGLDHKRIKEFDGWIKLPKNYIRYLSHPRSIAAFQVRRLS